MVQYSAQDHGSLSDENSVDAPAMFGVVPFIFVVVFERPREEGIIASARRDRSDAVQKFIREARRYSQVQSQRIGGAC